MSNNEKNSSSNIEDWKEIKTELFSPSKRNFIWSLSNIKAKAWEIDIYLLSDKMFLQVG